MDVCAPSQKQHLKYGQAKVGVLIQRDIPKCQKGVICRLMKGLCLQNGCFPYLQVKELCLLVASLSSNGVKTPHF